MRCNGDICNIIEKVKKDGRRIESIHTIKKESSLINETAASTYYIEDPKYIRIYNFPAAQADKETKMNTAYSDECIKNAVNQYNHVINNEQPFLKYMLDGHEDGEDFSRVVGAVDRVQYDEQRKTVFIDFTIYKSSKIGRLISDILANGDPIGVSMVLLHRSEVNIDRDEIKYYYEDLETLEDISEAIPKLFAAKQTISYVNDPECYIIRFDLTFIPSMYNAYASFDNSTVKKESTKLNKKVINKKSCKGKKKKKYTEFKELKEALNYIKVKNPFTIQLNSATSWILNNNINLSFVDEAVVKNLQKVKDFDLIFDKKTLKDVFNYINSTEYFNKLQKENIKSDILDNLNSVFKEAYIADELYSYDVIYDIIKLLTYIYLNPNAKINIVQQNYEPEKEVKINRLKTFINDNKQDIYNLIESKNASEFFKQLYIILDKHIAKYKSILTTYGAIIEALRLIRYILSKNIDIDKILEENKNNNENKTKKESLKLNSNKKKILKKFYI